MRDIRNEFVGVGNDDTACIGRSRLVRSFIDTVSISSIPAHLLNSIGKTTTQLLRLQSSEDKLRMTTALQLEHANLSKDLDSVRS